MSIRIIHTSDWHLGKKLYKIDRIPEQQMFLDWLVEKVIDEKADYLLIAGDIFDTPVPTNPALTLYFQFLKKIIDKTSTEVVIIAGNHDSGKFLEAPKEILKSQKIHILGNLAEDPKQHLLTLKKKDSKTSIDLVALPYFRNFELQNLRKRYSVVSENDSPLEQSEITLNTLGSLLKEVLESSNNQDHNRYKILLTHHLFGNFDTDGSEQALALSGIDSIPNSLIDNLFDHVALGHIHKPQSVKKESPSIYYAGSPIPLRFSESNKKSIALLNFSDQTREIHQKKIEVPIFRRLEVIKCKHDNYQEEIEKLKTIESDNQDNSRLSTLLEIHIRLIDPISGLADEIRNSLEGSNIELLSVFTIFGPTNKKSSDSDLLKIGNKLPNIMELFTEFYKTKHTDSTSVPKEIQEDFIKLLDRINTGISQL